ncbi:hypothetical protein [Pseudomonas indica]|uniref:hypothetical protein n=1 Tax=Pseudomonas indica TaxID=137658 RepID=UPI0023F8B4D0|nr:hypothetical protein [Pseudomonas indica]MBU3055845.1 hypothetical protein [Pseudomonas indica]
MKKLSTTAPSSAPVGDALDLLKQHDPTAHRAAVNFLNGLEPMRGAHAKREATLAANNDARAAQVRRGVRAVIAGMRRTLEETSRSRRATKVLTHLGELLPHVMNDRYGLATVPKRSIVLEMLRGEGLY